MTKFFAVAIAAAALLVGCSKDGDNGGKLGNQAQKATIKVKFDLNKAPFSGRAFDDVDVIDTDRQDRVEIKNAVIFLFKSNGDLAASRALSDLTLAKGAGENFTGDNITTDINLVMIVGNTGDIFGSVATIDDLQNVIKSLSDVQTAYGLTAGDGTTGTIWVYGEAAVGNWQPAVTEGGPKTSTTSVTDINPIISRIDITVDPTGGYGWIGGKTSELNATPLTEDAAKAAKMNYVKLDDAGVAVLYSSAYTFLTPEFNPDQAALTAASLEGKLLVSGIVPSDEDEVKDGEWETTARAEADLFGTGNTDNILLGSWNGTWKIGSTDEPNVVSNVFKRSFYALPTNGAYQGATVGLEAHPVVTLFATVYEYDTVADDGTYTERRLFWPVHFRTSSKYTVDGVANSNGVEMQNGMRYSVSLRLNGDLTKGGGKPEAEEPADVTIKVSQAKWKGVINIEAEFNE